LKTSSDQQAKESLRAFFVMDAVAKKLGIEATQEEINGYIAQAAMYRQVRPEKLREQMARDGSLAEAALEIREIKCIDKILETAKISEVAPEKLAAKSKKSEAPAEKKTAPKKEAEKKPAKKAEKAEPKKEKKAAPKKPAAKKKTK
jgi:FKBP-type peptidyl-prolyl cis-trans isomerase (trigger factor)